MSAQLNPAARRWYHRLRLSIRGLIVVVLLIGGWLGWFARSARIQREAVAAIKRSNGDFRYDWQWKNGSAIAAGEPWAPGWLVDTFGVDYFGNVASVEVGLGAPDDDLINVGRLTELRDLSMIGHNRCRAEASGGADETQLAQSQRCSDYRCWAAASHGAHFPLVGRSR